MHEPVRSVKASIQTCGLTLEQNHPSFKPRTRVFVPGEAGHACQGTDVRTAVQQPASRSAGKTRFPPGCSETCTQSVFAVLTVLRPDVGPEASHTGPVRPGPVPGPCICAPEQDTEAPAGLDRQPEGV